MKAFEISLSRFRMAAMEGTSSQFLAWKLRSEIPAVSAVCTQCVNLYGEEEHAQLVIS